MGEPRDKRRKNWMRRLPSGKLALTGALAATAATMIHGADSADDAEARGAPQIAPYFGFDTCQTLTQGQLLQMWTWSVPWTETVGVYAGGATAEVVPCHIPNREWVDYAELSIGYGIVFIWDDLQPPCTVNSEKTSWTPAYALEEGMAAADAALYTIGVRYGVDVPSVVYLDIEWYDPDYGDEDHPSPTCRTATNNYIKGWTLEIENFNWRSGVYAGSSNGMKALLDGACWNWPVTGCPMNAWMANWGAPASVWDDEWIDDGYWYNHQRFRQFAAGVAPPFLDGIEIDYDCNLGHVAGGNEDHNPVGHDPKAAHLTCFR